MSNGPGDVLDLIRRGRVATRGDVVEATGLSRMTVAQRVDALLGAGIIVEGETTGATGGRRRRSLVFDHQQSLALVCAVDTTHARVAVTDLRGSVVDESDVRVQVDRGPQVVLDELGRVALALLERQQLDPAALCGTAVSLPGPIDPQTGRPSQPPILPGWDDYDVAGHLGALLPGTRVLTANDADASALGEQTHAFADVRSLCLVKVATGIGTGIVIDGRSYTGADGGAGDIGHVRVSPESDVLCQCGMTGCLAAVASGRAVARRLDRPGRRVTSGREVGELIRAGDAEAARLTQEAGRVIGEVMSTVVCLLNPEVLLLGGALASPPLLSGIGETLYRRSLPRATRHLQLRLGTLGERAAVAGLTRLVVDDRFGAEAVNARLRA